MKRVIFVVAIVAFLAVLAGCGPRFWLPSTPDTPTSVGSDASPEGILVTLALWSVWAGGLLLILSVPVFIWVPDKRKAGSVAVTGAGLAAGGVIAEIFASNLWLVLGGCGVAGAIYVLRRNPDLAGKLENALPGQPDIPGIGPDQSDVETERYVNS